jgi:putative selenate reductase
VGLRRDGSGWKWEEKAELTLEEQHQIGIFADFCNKCGNCDIFCPEDGGPYAEKPLFFGSETSWRKLPERDGFYIESEMGETRAWGRIAGEEYGLEMTENRFTCRGPGFTIRFDPESPEDTVEGEGPEEVDLGPHAILQCIVDGVQNPERVNYVNIQAKEEHP